VFNFFDDATIIDPTKYAIYPHSCVGHMKRRFARRCVKNRDPIHDFTNTRKLAAIFSSSSFWNRFRIDIAIICAQLSETYGIASRSPSLPDSNDERLDVVVFSMTRRSMPKAPCETCIDFGVCTGVF